MDKLVSAAKDFLDDDKDKRQGASTSPSWHLPRHGPFHDAPHSTRLRAELDVAMKIMTTWQFSILISTSIKHKRC